MRNYNDFCMHGHEIFKCKLFKMKFDSTLTIPVCMESFVQSNTIRERFLKFYSCVVKNVILNNISVNILFSSIKLQNFSQE